jgi:hypothetical protein
VCALRAFHISLDPALLKEARSFEIEYASKPLYRWLSVTTTFAATSISGNNERLGVVTLRLKIKTPRHQANEKNAPTENE